MIFAAAAVALLLAGKAEAWETCATPAPLTHAQKTLPDTVPSGGPGRNTNAWLGALDVVLGEVSSFEGPIAIRLAMMTDMLTWSCIAAYSEDWNDGIFKDEAPIVGHSPPDLHTSDLRSLCMLHGFATLFPTLLSTSVPAYEAYAADLGVPVELGAGFPEDASSDIAMCFDAYQAANDFAWDDDVESYYDRGDHCPDDILPPGRIPAIRRPRRRIRALRRCLSEAAACQAWDPAFVGPVLARFVHEWFYYDGFNAAGDIGADGTPCTANCRSFSDYTGYFPENHPGHSSRQSDKHWQPLQEGDGNGFFYRQEHVTPQIGTGALPVVLSKRDVRKRKARNPRYHFSQEARKVIQRLKDNTDEDKMLIEMFDNKINVAIQTITELINKYGSRAPFEVLALYAAAFTAAEHDATIIAWKEKVRWDSVRTTTVVQDMDKKIETWAGPGQGVQEFKARDFQPYIRIMPHAEYPSGSACQCQAFLEVTDGFIEHTYGDDDSISFTLAFPAGSSRIEPGVTPAEDVHVFIPNFKEIRDTCGQSRLNGGQHFTKSVSASYKLCEGVGDQTLEYVKGLTNGQSVLAGLH